MPSSPASLRPDQSPSSSTKRRQASPTQDSKYNLRARAKSQTMAKRARPSRKSLSSPAPSTSQSADKLVSQSHSDIVMEQDQDRLQLQNQLQLDQDQDDLHSLDHMDQDDEDHDQDHHDHDDDHDDDQDDDQDMDDSDIAALRASEALFGFDRSSSQLPHRPSGLSSGSAAAAAMAGLDSIGLRGLGGLMAGFTNRLKNILSSLRAKGPSASTERLVALQELAEILAVSTEDTLSGYFQTEAFAQELIAIIKGDPSSAGDDLPAAMTASVHFDNPTTGSDVEQMLLASRCLANCMEALPGSAHTIVHHGAVPVLCAKLLEINFIDLAEQSLSTLEKISEELPASIVREGGLTALLQYLDFFSTNVQRTAVTTAANCCVSVSADDFDMVRDVFPILRTVLSYADQRVSEQAVLAITRVTDSYRHHPDKLSLLLTPDVLSSLTALLSPIGGTKISESIFSAILKSFTNVGRTSPEVATNLLDAGLADTIYGILVGQLPPDIEDEHDLALELTRNSSIITQALMRKDKAQIQQAIDLIVEVLPPLPKDGIFDSKLSKKPSTSDLTTIKQEDPLPPMLSLAPLADEDVKPDISAVPQPTSKEAAIARRIELLQSPEREHTMRRLNALLLPTLLEAYGASVNPSIRLKTLIALLKIAYFNKPEYLARTLKPVPMASFLSSIVANWKDLGGVVVYALQLIDLLLERLPEDYFFFFRREGVFHEVDRLADQTLSPCSSSSRTGKAPGRADSSSSEDHQSSSRRSTSALQGSSAFVYTGPSASSSSSSTRDQLIYRARHLRNSYAGEETTASLKALEMLDHIREMSSQLEKVQGVEEAGRLVEELAELFGKSENPVSSFEVAESGLVGSLLRFITEHREFGREPIIPKYAKSLLACPFFFADDCDLVASLSTRRELVSKSFIGSFDSRPAYVPLVRRLQESLGKLEGFEVLSAASSSSSDDARRTTGSMLARQIKIRLVAAEGSDVPKNCANVVVSIHAIATFQAFNDYLRPRIIKGMDDERLGRSSSAGRLSGMLAAFAAAAGLPSPMASGSGGSASGSSPGGLESLGLTISASPESSSSAAGSTQPSTSAPTADPVPANASAVNAYLPRRSSRLSGRGLTAEDFDRDAASKPLPVQAGPGPSSLSTSAPTRSLSVEERRRNTGREFMDVDEGVPTVAGPIDEDMAQANSIDEPPVNVQPTPDGTKIEVHTPHGTRVTTPHTSRPPSALATRHSSSAFVSLMASASAAAQRPPKSSYAAAVKAEPKDWHLSFALGGQNVALDTTIYGAVYTHDLLTGGQGRNLWGNVYTVTFKKTDGPAPPPAGDDALSAAGQGSSSAREDVILPASIAEGSEQALILRLLRAFHRLSLDWAEVHGNASAGGARDQMNVDGVFVNNKLTAKLNRQLEEPMIVASACLPDWACDLPQGFPFLFPFETRFSLLQSTSFGYARLIQKWIGQARADSARRDENLGLLGRLQRQKVRISRQKILESLMKVFEIYSSCRAMLEVEYFDEVGTGLGPTLEFFSLASKAFAERQYGMWRDHDSDGVSLHVFSRSGLFPAPMDSAMCSTDAGQERLKKFKVLGQFMAKSLMDSRIVDISLSRSFARLVLDYELALTIDSVRLVDRALAASLDHLQKYVEEKKRVLERDPHAQIEAIKVDGATVEDLALEFVLPGYAVQMISSYCDSEDQSPSTVNMENLEEFIRLVIDWTLCRGVQRQIEAFKTGFSTVFPIRDLKSFTPDEIVNIFGNSEGEDWSAETLTAAIRADHGYNMESRSIRNLIEIMSSFDVQSRREFLQFITGAPKLPIGGFRGLHPPLTVVRKAAEPGHTPDEYLPSVMTCVNYLKLPEYSSSEVSRIKIGIAMREGADSFHLS